MPAAAAKPPRPTCPALNLCLNAYQLPDGTFNLEQVFTRLLVGVFPLKLELHVHYHVFDGHGRYLMEAGRPATTTSTPSAGWRRRSTCTIPATRTTRWSSWP